MHLLIKKRYGLGVAIVYIFLLFIGEALGGNDPPDMEPMAELTKEMSQEVQGIAREEPQPLKVITRLFEVKNVNVKEAKERLQSLLTKDKNVASGIEIFTVEKSGKEFNYLLVKDTPENIERIGLVIEQLEKEFTPILVNVDFTDVELSKILTTLVRTTDLNIIGGDELSQKVSIHLRNIPVDDLFDILLKSSGYVYLREGKVLRIIPEGEVPLLTEVFELQNVPAPKIEEAVSNLISKRGQAKSFSKFQNNNYSNSLIVTDTQEAVERIRKLIKSLDKKIRQVVIKAQFAEVTLKKDDKLGIDWVLKASISGAKGPTTFPIEQTNENIPFPPTSITPTSGSITLGTISFSDFSATIQALDTKTKTSLIASPSIATRDGEEAEIVIGDKVPIPLYERNEQTGTIEITGYQNENIGVLLRVTPIINNDNTVTLKVHPEVSEITSYTGPNNERPVVSTREVTTMFTVESGKTIVLGGLTKKTVSNSLHKVPFFGNIPILGKIFTFKDDSDTRKELLIFITPSILNESESAGREKMQ